MSVCFQTPIVVMELWLTGWLNNVAAKFVQRCACTARSVNCRLDLYVV